MPWPKGKPRSEKTKKYLSELFKGRIFSKEWKENLSKAGKGRKVPWIKGKKQSLEIREKRSESLQGHVVSQETKAKISKMLQGNIPWNKDKKNCFSKETTKKLREARLKQKPPLKDSSIEVALQNELTRRRISYEKHIPLYGVIPDLIFKDEKVVVFADGDYWHGKEFKGGQTWKRDRMVDKYFGLQGWAVLRFWEHEINDDVESCVDKIEEKLK